MNNDINKAKQILSNINQILTFLETQNELGKQFTGTQDCNNLQKNVEAFKDQDNFLGVYGILLDGVSSNDDDELWDSLEECREKLQEYIENNQDVEQPEQQPIEETKQESESDKNKHKELEEQLSEYSKDQLISAIKHHCKINNVWNPNDCGYLFMLEQAAIDNGSDDLEIEKAKDDARCKGTVFNKDTDLGNCPEELKSYLQKSRNPVEIPKQGLTESSSCPIKQMQASREVEAQRKNKLIVKTRYNFMKECLSDWNEYVMPLISHKKSEKQIRKNVVLELQEYCSKSLRYQPDDDQSSLKGFHVPVEKLEIENSFFTELLKAFEKKELEVLDVVREMVERIAELDEIINPLTSEVNKILSRLKNDVNDIEEKSEERKRLLDDEKDQWLCEEITYEKVLEIVTQDEELFKAKQNGETNAACEISHGLRKKILSSFKWIETLRKNYKEGEVGFIKKKIYKLRLDKELGEKATQAIDEKNEGLLEEVIDTLKRQAVENYKRSSKYQEDSRYLGRGRNFQGSYKLQREGDYKKMHDHLVNELMTVQSMKELLQSTSRFNELDLYMDVLETKIKMAERKGFDNIKRTLDKSYAFCLRQDESFDGKVTYVFNEVSSLIKSLGNKERHYLEKAVENGAMASRQLNLDPDERLSLQFHITNSVKQDSGEKILALAQKYMDECAWIVETLNQARLDDLSLEELKSGIAQINKAMKASKMAGSFYNDAKECGSKDTNMYSQSYARKFRGDEVTQYDLLNKAKQILVKRRDFIIDMQIEEVKQEMVG